MNSWVIATIATGYVDVSPSGWVAIVRGNEITIADATDPNQPMTIYKYPNIWNVRLMKLVGEHHDGGATEILLIGGNDVNSMTLRVLFRVDSEVMTVEQWGAESNEVYIALGRHGYRRAIQHGNQITVQTPFGVTQVVDDEFPDARISEQYVMTSTGKVYDVVTGQAVWWADGDVEIAAITSQTLAALVDEIIVVVDLSTGTELAQYNASNDTEDILGVIEGTTTVVLMIDEPGEHGVYRIALQFGDIENNAITIMNDSITRAWFHGRNITVLTTNRTLVRYSM